MRAIIRERRALPLLRSGSALERVGAYYFAIGDDSSELVCFDGNWNVAGRTRLFDSTVITGARITKQEKPDLEALCCVEWHGHTELLCFGSGSKSPVRDVCFRVDVTDPAAPQNVRAVPLTAFYNTLRANADIVGGYKLNIEAAASTPDQVFLFQRGNISNLNVSTHFPLESFMRYLDSPASLLPVPRLVAFTLPALGSRRAGFSAATTWHDSFLIAASVEDTDNEIDDGAILGSYIGLVEQDKLVWNTVVEQNDAIAPLKIEGIAVASATEHVLIVAALTDDDRGNTELLEIEIR